MNTTRRKALFGLVLFLVSIPLLAAPPQKNICPAPGDEAARRAAVEAACRHFGSAPKGWGMHSAFGPRGEIIDCLHFTCGASRPAAATRSDAGDRAPKRFMLRFSDAYLVHEPGRGSLQITAQGSVLSYGNDWQVRKLKPYLYHLRQDNWKGIYWKVNTSRKAVYKVKGGRFGQLGGSEKRTGINVDVVGNAESPTRFFLRFQDAYLVQPAKARPQVVAEGSALSYGSDWQVKRLKPYLYHLRQNNWQQFFWKVNTSRKEMYRVTGGQFGRLGGRDEKLGITVEPVY
ncbi:MAG: hypothetical protein ABW089_07990 [Sedimenticola sp.]